MGTAQTSLEQCTIPVSGMTCAACSARIQRTLERREGVSAANVNLMTGAATVTYDPAATGPEGGILCCAHLLPHPEKLIVASRPHITSVSTMSVVTIRTRLARMARPEAIPTPSGPPVAW